MFEIVEIGPEVTTGLLRKRSYRQVKLCCVTPVVLEILDRTFEGYQKFTVQTYRAEFTESEVITIQVPSADLIAVGDRVSAESLRAQGHLQNRFQLVRTTG